MRALLRATFVDHADAATGGKSGGGRFQPATAPRPALAEIGDFLKVLSAAFARAGGRLETMGEAGGLPLLAWSRRAALGSGSPATASESPRAAAAAQPALPQAPQTSAAVAPAAATGALPRPRPRIYLSAGIHGDEPAGPLALLELASAGFFDERAHWLVCPALNPLGLQHGTRENAQALDLNRDYRQRRSQEAHAHTRWLQAQPCFDLTLCLHEDWEATGFYLYEHNSTGRPSLAQALLDAVRPIMPIEPAHEIDGRTIDEPGILRPKTNTAERDDWPEQLYLYEQKHSTLGYTFETPSALPLATRIAAQCTLVRRAVDGLVKEFAG